MTSDRHFDERPHAARHARAVITFVISSHLGPDLFVLRSRTSFAPRAAQHIVDHVVGRTHERFDAVHRADIRHLLFVRLFTFAAARMRTANAFFQRSPHRHAFAVGRRDQDFRVGFAGGRSLR